MFDFVRSHTKLFQFLLLLVIVPAFVFGFGLQGYNKFTGPGNTTVVKVGSGRITQEEFDNAHRRQIERIRRQAPGVDIKMFDTPQVRQQLLDTLVRDRVLQEVSEKLHLNASDERIRSLMASDPQLASLRGPDGSISKDRYIQALAENGLTPQEFEANYPRQQVLLGVSRTSFAPAAAASAAFDAFFQQRELQLQRFDAKDYASKVTPTDADIEKFYKDPANAALFQAEEQANIEYVMLDVDSLAKSVKVTDEQLKHYYDQNEKLGRYTTQEERKASHILVKVDKSAPAEERAKAKAKAEALLAEVKKNPGNFAEIAKKNSDDKASAQRGGDLDFFNREAMVKPFTDAAFSMKEGEISGLVETDYGYHIIKVTGAHAGGKKTFEEVKPEIEKDVRRAEAQKLFAEKAVDFTNTVYEQSDSLKPAVDKFKLELRTAQNVKRTPSPNAPAPLNSEKLMAALFAPDIVKNKRNTDAVEVGPNQLVSARIVQYTAAHTVPLAEVKDMVRERVIQAQATALARKDGEARLAELKKDPQAALAGEAVLVSRAASKDLPRQVVDAALRADASKLPAAVGVELPNGYAVLRLTKVLGRDPAAPDAARALPQMAQAVGEAETMAYYAALKTRLKVETKDKSLKVSTDAASAPK
jgi:peptidyl-prolyl cis-trans isomerase D